MGLLGTLAMTGPLPLMAAESGSGSDPAVDGLLLARPLRRALSDTAAQKPGEHVLGLTGTRDGLIHVPPGYDAASPAPLVVMLHGAGGRAEQLMPLLSPIAEEYGCLLAAPDARGRTWDVILGAYGPDVQTIDRMLAQIFARWSVDPAQVAIGGFSDGASYALSLGLINGDLFQRVLAYSPGFTAPTAAHGRPQFYVSHGTDDPVLPVDRTSRRIVPQLREAGYQVRYHEFEGGHTVPPEIARESAEWFLGT
jgi:phospholipase/carboxylesterase